MTFPLRVKMMTYQLLRIYLRAKSLGAGIYGILLLGRLCEVCRLHCWMGLSLQKIPGLSIRVYSTMKEKKY